MKIYHQHQWNISISEAFRVQHRLKNQVVLTENPPLSTIQTVAAADISFSKGSHQLFGAVVLVQFPDLVPIEIYYASGKVDFPYVPGYLSFREIPILIKIFEKINHTVDIVLCDSQGIAHPRRFGLACHLGVLLDKPTIGCAKSRLIGSYEPPDQKKGAYAYLYDGEEKIGVVLRSRENVKPIFVSPGHRMSIENARKVAARCVKKYRIPEPLRLAHQKVNKLRRKSEGN
ncbi:MAG: deoxyribonuclease V [Calditrichae bacterium]|nr:deoxyribonuclease V [Calditrichia bacterium]